MKDLIKEKKRKVWIRENIKRIREWGKIKEWLFGEEER